MVLTPIDSGDIKIASDALLHNLPTDIELCGMCVQGDVAYEDGPYEKQFEALQNADFNNMANVDVTRLVLALPKTMRSFKSYEIGITKETLEKFIEKLTDWNKLEVLHLELMEDNLPGEYLVRLAKTIAEVAKSSLREVSLRYNHIEGETLSTICELLSDCIKLNKVCLDGITNLKTLKYEELCDALKKFFVSKRSGPLEVTFSKYYFKFPRDVPEQEALDRINNISDQLFFKITDD